MSPEKHWLEDDPFLLKCLIFGGHSLVFGCVPKSPKPCWAWQTPKHIDLLRDVFDAFCHFFLKVFGLRKKDTFPRILTFNFWGYRSRMNKQNLWILKSQGSIMFRSLDWFSRFLAFLFEMVQKITRKTSVEPEVSKRRNRVLLQHWMGKSPKHLYTVVLFWFNAYSAITPHPGCQSSPEFSYMFSKESLKNAFICHSFYKKGPPNYYFRGFIPSYTHLQPWLNRVCWGYNYLYN